jgi:thiamine pyrophosphate-dependent acetolactate synthase large subunit-like protein
MKRDIPSAASSEAMRWGSDAIAATLAALDLRYIALNPGSSYRGLHDSLVNHLGNENPALLTCLHEEHAVAIAHGYAKVTGRPMAVVLHSNVGLMHATMAIYNAFCDRVPMLILGATGPLDAARRRPWIDWIHTAGDQGALIRNFCKWDDQPGSPQAAIDSVMQAHYLTRVYPSAPAYVCLDSQVQEQALSEALALPDPERFKEPEPPAPSPQALARAATILAGAARPLILIGRVSAGEEHWQARIELAERLGACVLTDLKTQAAFPSDHRLNPAVPGLWLTPTGKELVEAADVILSLDWIDLAGTLGSVSPKAAVVSATLDHTLHNGWSKDHFGLPAADLQIAAHPDALVSALLKQVDGVAGREGWPPALTAAPPPGRPSAAGLPMGELVDALNGALSDGEACLVRVPLGLDGAYLKVDGPLDYLGHDGGGGLGSGPGMAVGAALALSGDERLAVAVLGDGDFLMGSSAIWTAVHYGLRLLIVVANNRSFFNDEVHQEQVARTRERPVENRWLGQHIRDPDPDLATLARSLGAVGHGPVQDEAALSKVLAKAVETARAGAVVVVDVRVSADG